VLLTPPGETVTGPGRPGYGGRVTSTTAAPPVAAPPTPETAGPRPPGEGDAEDFSVGVEEEFFLVDAETSALCVDADAVLARTDGCGAGETEHELKRSQVESGTPVCRTIDEVRAALCGLRRSLADAAEAEGARLVATGTHPFARWDDDGGVTDEAAYVRLQDTYEILAVEQMVSGCHVHVGVTDPELAIAVMNRLRGWVPVLVALTANSPYWMGRDSGYGSYRTEVFHRWPTAGVPEHFEDRADYERLVDHLTAIGAIDTPARLYWDIRPSARYPTVEFRATDVALTVDESVTVAALVRALVETAHRAAVTGEPFDRPRPEVVRAALWRAARYGLADRLVCPVATTTKSAAEVVGTLLDVTRPVLEARDEWQEVAATCARLLDEGTGAERQRRAADAARGDLCAVVDHAARATLAGVA
jgi:glutamate---cysteine ligase / carboxylate-amine ligase